MKIPIYDAFLSEGENEGLSCISIVDEPAMEKEMLVFNKDSRPVMFSVQDEMQHKITSVVIRCGYPVYRIDETGKEYYIRFGRDVIEQLAEKYSKDGLLNKVSVQHNGELLDGITMVEFFIKDIGKGINPVGFEDIEDHSLFCTFKVNNDKVWDRIVEGEFGGLSMEVFLDMKPTDEYVEEDSYWDELWEYLTGEDFESKKKTDFSLDKGDIIRALEKRNTIKIDEGSEVRTYFPHSLGRRDGKDVVILYDPATGKWSVRELGSIGKYIITTNKIGEFDYSDPSYDSIMDDDSITVSRSTVSTGDGFIDAIKNRTWVQIAYDDEQEPKHTGYRQCMVVAYGYTHAGNVAVRCYQQFGDTRTTTPDYKIFLVKRMQAFKPMTNTEPWNDSMLDSRFHSGGDKNLNYPLIYAHKLGL